MPVWGFYNKSHHIDGLGMYSIVVLSDRWFDARAFATRRLGLDIDELGCDHLKHADRQDAGVELRWEGHAAISTMYLVLMVRERTGSSRKWDKWKDARLA